MPARKADVTKASVLIEDTLMPIEEAAMRSSLLAMIALP